MSVNLIEMADKVFGEGSEAAAKAVLDWQLKGGHVSARSRLGAESWYDQYEKPFHPELGQLGMRVFAQVISASCCDQNWSQHGHIHSDLLNKIAPQRVETVCMFTQTRR